MRVALALVLLAQLGVSFDPIGGAKSRHRVRTYRFGRLECLAVAQVRPTRTLALRVLCFSAALPAIAIAPATVAGCATVRAD
jgi:hypothetical protein